MVEKKRTRSKQPKETKKTETKKSKFESTHDYDDKTQYKFISWNVNGFSAMWKKGDGEYLKELAQHEKPVAICIQETKLTESTSKKFKDCLKGYNVHFNHCKTKNGYSGTADDIKPLNVSFGMGDPKHDQEGRLITVEYPEMYLVCTYVPNSGQKLERLKYRTQEWDPAMFSYLKKLEQTKPVVWTGDLNVAILEIDVHNPKGNRRTAGFTDEERAEFKKILDAGWIDSFRKFHKDEPGNYTYWGYRFNMRAKDKGWRLDYFVTSRSLDSKIVDSYILKHVMGSDHCPIGIILNKNDGKIVHSESNADVSIKTTTDSKSKN